jgi:hypothetical protein
MNKIQYFLPPIIIDFLKLIKKKIKSNKLITEPKNQFLELYNDPEMAKTVRPKSLRAVYGKDKGKNAVHCTDLSEDGILEV